MDKVPFGWWDVNGWKVTLIGSMSAIYIIILYIACLVDNIKINNMKKG